MRYCRRMIGMLWVLFLVIVLLPGCSTGSSSTPQTMSNRTCSVWERRQG